jgi:streptomycin 6-kinase
MTAFDPWLDQWALGIDGSAIRTASSDLLPVLRDGAPAMLKIARTREEQRGASILKWYAGEGAVRVLEIDGPALLLERVRSDRSLAAMSKSGRDDTATRILCAAVRTLHAARDSRPPSDLIPLAAWFRALESGDDPRLAPSKAVARALLADMHSIIPLHGDIHHDNVLHDRGRGWLAIDPKGLLGERTFDYTNIFCNADLESATASTVFLRRLDVVAEESNIDRERLLKWVFAYAGLSLSWCMEDDDRDGVALRLAIVEIASREVRVR